MESGTRRCARVHLPSIAHGSVVARQVRSPPATGALRRRGTAVVRTLIRRASWSGSSRSRRYRGERAGRAESGRAILPANEGVKLSRRCGWRSAPEGVKVELTRSAWMGRAAYAKSVRQQMIVRALLVSSSCLLAAYCGPKPTELPSARSSAAVYSAVIDAALFDTTTRDAFDIRPSWRPDELRVPERGHGLTANDTIDSRASLRRELAGLPESLLSGYPVLPDSAVLLESIVARVPVVFLPDEQFRRELRKIDRAAPILAPFRSQALHLTLSPVLFSTDSTSAVVEIASYRAPLDASGHIVWLTHTSSGWVIRAHFMNWVS